MWGISGILPPSIELVTGGQASCYIAANLCFMVNSVGTTAVNIGEKVEMRCGQKWRWVPHTNVLYLVLVLAEQ